MLSPYVEIDKYAQGRENNEYTVRSIYFDTPDFQNYYDKVDGLSFRKKVRLRGYNLINGSNQVFLETKNKFRLPLHKTRAKVEYESTLESFENGNLRQIIQSVTKNHSEANSFIYQLSSLFMSGNPIQKKLILQTAYALLLIKT
jgi:SPX domain protein involved in polyphosphate accumulation